MSKKNILVVSQYFYPEQFRINDICETWVKEGHNVTVLTGIPNYPQGKFYEGYGFLKKRHELYNGMEIIRIPIVPRGSKSVTLALNYASFVASGTLWNLLHKKKYDFVFVYEVSPMTQAIPAVNFAKKNKIPCYIYVMDLWPENVVSITGLKNKKAIQQINRMIDYIYTNCEKIFTASRSFKENIQQRGVPKEKIIFWPQYAEEFYGQAAEPSKKIVQDDKINVTFAGNIGTAQGLEILPETAMKVKELGLNIRFNLVGDGRYKETLQTEIERKGIKDYFSFIDPVPATEVPAIMSASDFSLISLQENEIFSMTIPAKIQSSMACGKPILLSASGEVADIINESGSGLTSEAGDVAGLVENLKKITQLSKQDILKMGKNSRKYFKSNFEKDKLMHEMDQYLNMGDKNNV